MSRKLATYRIINNIQPIEGADQIEIVMVDSWKVVAQKNKHKIGEIVVYFEIDSWVPTTIAPFLSKGKTPSKFNEIEGKKLKTIKLRGQISQGLVMSVEDIKNVITDFNEPEIEGTDLTKIIGVQKWEIPSTVGAYLIRGNFPTFIKKTDQDRVQNLRSYYDIILKQEWEITEKYDGSSMTVYHYKHGEELEEGVCSKNLDLKKESDDSGTLNSYWEIAIREKLQEKLREAGLNIALQGELVGIKINNNIYELTNRDFWLFDIYDIDRGTYFSPEERQNFAKKYDIKHVPVIHNNFKLKTTVKENTGPFSEGNLEIEFTINDIIKFAEGKSVLNKKTEREGLVFKNMKNDMSINSFKVISNKYLLKHQ